jgi:hypothetical protein
MPTTYTLITSTVLGSGSSDVTFSSIPQTYTDLVVRVSMRSTGANQITRFNINGDAGNFYSYTVLQGNGGTVGTSNNTGVGTMQWNESMTSSTDTGSTFGVMELYIPNYTATQNRQLSNVYVTEGNTSTQYINLNSNLYKSSTAITSISFTKSSFQFAIGSSFNLYGIKKN